MGKLAPTAQIGEGEWFSVIKSYFDKSGQEDQHLLTVGVIAATDDVWAEIEADWNHILRSNKPPADYMHMVEAINLRDEFSSNNGWDDDHVYGLLNLLLSYLATSPTRSKYCQFSCSLKMDDYNKLLAETYQLDSPADIVATACVRKMSEWYFEHYKGLDFESHLYFDQGEPFEEIIKAKWNRSREGISPRYQWMHISHIGPAVMRKTPGLQIADMIAWATNRHEVKIPRRYDDLALTMRMLLPSFWVVVDERQLRRHYRPLIYNPYGNQ